MKKVFFFILITIFFESTSFATHIVGGEFEIIHLHDNVYLFRQIQYFDKIYGNPEAQDAYIDASIFRKSDDSYIRNVRMYPVSDVVIPYSNPSCDNDIIVTKRIVYEETLELDPDEFDDPLGYYMVWERCCRNHAITNIVSPDITGQTFYIEFPPLMKNGQRFIDSTPTLFPPLRDYACVGQFYYADFKGYDKDGDSLVYSLVTPLNSTETNLGPNPLPDPKPNPHPDILWSDGFSEEIQVPGTPPLKLSNDGLLTVVPSEEGLFVFGVKCEEFRNGQKLGEVSRDFQIFVVDCPPPGNKPRAQARVPGSDEYFDDIENVNINYGDDSCFEIIVNDGDPNEFIRVKAVAINFTDSLLQENLSIDQGYITNPNDTLKFEFCFPQCINEGSYDPAIVDLLVYDNRCPQSLIDSLRISAVVNQPPNEDPAFVQPSQKIQSLLLSENQNYSIPIEAVDADNDSLAVQIIPVDFNFEDYGIDVSVVSDEDGNVEYELNWDTNCEDHSFADKSHFDIMAIVEDYDVCQKNNTDTIYYSIDIDLPPNNPPQVFINGSPNDTTLYLKIEELRNLLISATDQDANDQVILSARAAGYDLSELGLEFDDITGNGNIQQNFGLKIDCGILDIEEVNQLELMFIAEDYDKCKFSNADTVLLTVLLLPPDNTPPSITINGSNGDSLYFQVGEEIDVGIISNDPDGDNVSLTLMSYDSLKEMYGIEFESSSIGPVASSTLIWSATCDLLNKNYEPQAYSFTIKAVDDKCFTPMETVMKFNITIVDKLVDYDFLPPNVFTPNTEDNINSSFYIPYLPTDNCENRFEQIIIYNRWGNKVFSSKSRDFKWDGMDKSNGVYFYTLIYSNKTFKGIINLLR